MGSLRLDELRRNHPGMTDEEIARLVVDSSSQSRFAIRYTNRFTRGDEPTDLGVGFLAEEYAQYMSLRNAVVLYEKGHDDCEAAAEQDARAYRGALLADQGDGRGSAGEVDALIDEFRRDRFSDDDSVKAKLTALGQPAYRRVLAAALDDAETASVRKAMIYFLLVEARYDEAVQPLFDRYMKGKNPGYLSRNDDEGFGLWREVRADLEAIGIRFEAVGSSAATTVNPPGPGPRRKWWHFWA